MIEQSSRNKIGSSGIAGEFYVAAELTKRGMVATLTGKNTQDVDILAMNPNTGVMVSIQVKEKSTKDPGFYVSKHPETIERQKRLGIWYVCVDLFNNNKCYIAKAEQVFGEEYVGGALERERLYLEKPKKDGTKRKPSPSLYFVPEADGVKENDWEALPIFKTK